MRLEYSGVVRENIRGGINLSAMSAVSRNRYIKNIFTKKSSDMLEWCDLPEQDRENIKHVQEYGKYIRKKFDNFVVLGIGGSALGVRFLKSAFVDSIHKDIGINIYVCDNIDPDGFVSLISKLNLKKTMFNVITKSGSTSETLAQMSLVISKMNEKKIKLSSNMCITTTEGNDLWKFALENNIKLFDIPKGVGGRFSVLSYVGLVPASVMGIDVSKLLLGASIAKRNAQDVTSNNIAYTCAHINYTYLQKGMTNLVVMPYSDRLALFPDFFAQLWSESLGKRVNKKDEEVFAGQTPIKTLGVTDQHSQLQLFSEGIKDKLIMFLTVDQPALDMTIKDTIDLASSLKDVSLKKLLDYEYSATAYSLTTLGRPNYTLSISEVNEENIGALIFLSEMMTAFMGEMLGVDAYNQPGVELSKIYTKGCLKVKGYEKYASEIKDFAISKKYFSFE